MHDICISVNDRVILPFHEGFNFTKLRIYAKFHENKTLAKISEFTVPHPDTCSCVQFTFVKFIGPGFSFWDNMYFYMETCSFDKKISSITCHCGGSSRGVQLEHTDNFQPPCLMLAQCCIDRTTGFCNIRSVGPHRTTGLRIVCLSVTQSKGNMK